MAINKEKNVNLQVTFPKQDAKQLDNLVQAYENNGIKASRSGILVVAFRDYLRKVVMIGNQVEQEKHKNEVEEPQGDKKDA